MPRAKNRTVQLLAVGLFIAIAGSVSAQQAPQPPAAPGKHAAPPRAPAAPQETVQAQPPAQAGDTPQRTTATYDDWVVQCETQTGPPAQRICDMAQVTQVQAQGRTNPFSRVAIAHPVKGQPVKLVVQVPVNVSFATSVHIQTSDTDPGFVAPFARCLPVGCFAEFDIKDELLKKLTAASGAGKLSFTDGGGHDISVPLSFKGFSQAYDALAKE
jgi:invasion protein IalB